MTDHDLTRKPDDIVRINYIELDAPRSPPREPVARLCATPSLNCPNMKEREGDLSMEYEHYDCAVCGAHIKLDYEEMK